MQPTPKLTKAIRFALIGSIASTAYIANAYAAEDDTNAEQDVERITVTGSRIIREGTISPTPVTVITGEELLSTGATTIGEALNQLPALTDTFSLANSGRFIGTAGSSVLDLRGLGTDRTLVLVDGKRHVSSSAGSAAVDTNSIPAVWIERVEVITGGASAIYGADAVTGVVNFIMKKDINGFDITARKGFADDSSFSKDLLSLSYGTDFHEGRGNVAFAAEYNSQDRLRAFDRDQTSVSWANIENINQTPGSNDQSDPDNLYRPDTGHFTINNAGTFYLDGWKTFNNDGSIRDIYTGAYNEGDGEFDVGSYCSDCDFTNLRQYEDLQPEFESYNINFKTNYDIADNMNIYFEAKYSNTQAKSYSQPAFFFGLTDASIQPGFVNNIKVDNAFIDPELAALMTANGVSSININRFMNDLGQRVEDDERETQRYVLGLEGTLAEAWDYDVYAVYGQSDIDRVNSNNLVYSNYINALDSIIVNGEAVCRDETARAEGCVPVNIFGDGAVSQEAADYINTTSKGTAKVQQTVVGGSITNAALFELPAGYVGFSTGAEYRKEESVVHEPSNADDTFFNSIGEDKGDFDVKEVFAEVTVPLLSDIPLIYQLDMDLAIRYSDYSSVGDTTTWKAGLSWSINEELRMRSTFAHAIRAPNISELYGAPSETFYAISDVCKSSELANLSNSDIRAANCAALGVPTNFDDGYDSSRRPGLQSGNEDLKPEESDSYTVGLVYQPDFFEGFSMTVDYWNIEIEDAISGIGAQDIIERCVDDPNGINNEYCARITRDPSNNQITLIENSVINIAKLEAEGIDFDFAYLTELFGGDLRANLITTHLIKNRDYQFQDQTDIYIENAGTLGYADWQSNLMLNYGYNNWSAFWRTRYISGVDLYTEQDLENNANPSDNLEYGSYFISDTSLSYSFDSGVTLTFGMDNVFDRDLPKGSLGNGGGSSIYDNIGRYYYTAINYQF